MQTYPKTIQPEPFKVYDFASLPTPEAKQKALEWMRDDDGMRAEWEAEEWRSTLEAFQDWAPFRIHPDWEASSGYGRSYFRLAHTDHDWDEAEHYFGENAPGAEPPQGIRAWKWLRAWVLKNTPLGSEHIRRGESGPMTAYRLRKAKEERDNGSLEGAIGSLTSCHLTGVFYDLEACRPIVEALRGNPHRCPEPSEVFEQCYDALFRAYTEACEFRYSEEALAEDAEANGYEFLEDGSKA